MTQLSPVKQKLLELANKLASPGYLACKWLPRKGEDAAKLRNELGWSPKFYRKTLVELTNVVETAMCSGQWDQIDMEKLPSLASARYKKAFNRHVPQAFAEYAAKAVAGEAKINSAGVYPYDVLKTLALSAYGVKGVSKAELDHITAQWNALPNFVGDNKVLALVDVSGSMTCPAGGSMSVTCLDVAVSLGLYVADKNTGPFKDTFLTFSDDPELMTLKGNIVDKVTAMSKSKWGMSTNLHKALDKILETAVRGKATEEDMPKMLLIMSDMQFNHCTRFDDTALKMIKRKYKEAGYEVPAIVFWNLNTKDNVPVKADKSGVALVSGFSPAILTAVLSADPEEFTPRGVMMKAIGVERYNF